MKTFARWLLFLLILLTGLASLALYWTFYRPLPDYGSTLRMEGLRQPVEVHWDTYGVPHIYAENRQDLWFALGYVHAQDRLWQMTLSQMAAEGRFAEFLGKELLPYDRLTRTIGFWRIARRMERELPDSTRAVLRAYSQGVNSYTERNRKSLPIQFSLAGMEPLEWNPTRSLAMARLMAWELNLSWKAEIANALLREKLSPQQYRELFPDREPLPAEPPAEGEGRPAGGAGADTAGAPGLSSGRLASELLPAVRLNEQLRRLLGFGGTRVGSNAWAVRSSKTETGEPLLAGDPHLALEIPGKWYEVHLNVDGRNLTGATLAGAPAVILGRNDHLAWSMTNVMLDDTDFYVEALHPDDPGRYLADSLEEGAAYEPFVRQREVIRVRNGGDTLFTRRLTRHGPVISDIHPDSSALGGRVVSMRWTGHDNSRELEALMGMGWARSREEFLEAARRFRVPAQHVIYADRDDNIGRYTLGAVPLRAPNPAAFRPGWDPEMDWRGYLDFGELPHEENPESGWVANANNDFAGEGFPHYLSVYWHEDARYNRIRQYLEENETVSPALFRAMQNDTYSTYAAGMVDYILPVLETAGDPALEPAVSYLENWDYSYMPSETAASIMDLFLINFSRNVLADETGMENYASWIRFSGQPVRALQRFTRQGSSYFDDVNTPGRETEREVILHSMRQALDSLRAGHGPEPVEWRWERLHTLTLRPPLFGEAASDSAAPAALRMIVNNLLSKGPYGTGGHAMSLNNGEYRWNKPFDMVVGASIRRIIDLSDPGSTLSILPTGQSGNPLSAYYGDQTESWLEGEYKLLYRDSTLFRQTQVETMRLLPAGNR